MTKFTTFINRVNFLDSFIFGGALGNVLGGLIGIGVLLFVNNVDYFAFFLFSLCVGVGGFISLKIWRDSWKVS